MKYDKIMWGIVLILFGGMILLSNLGILQLSWKAVISLWPLIFIFWGISVLPVKNLIKLFLGLCTIALGLYIAVNHTTGNTGFLNFRYKCIERHFNADGWQSADKENVLYEDLDSNIQYARLSLSAVEGSYIINSSTDKLFSFKSKEGNGVFSLTTQKVKETADIGINLNKSGDKTDGIKESVLSLNPHPSWQINLSAGAAKLEADMSDLPVQKFFVDGKACALKLKFGNLSEHTDIEIDAAAATLAIFIPEKAACEVFSKTVLSSSSLEGFESIDKGHWQTENYKDENIPKFRVKINGALADINIIRYKE